MSRWHEDYFELIIIIICMLSRFSSVWLCATPKTAAHQAPLFTGFSRQKYWNGVPFPLIIKPQTTQKETFTFPLTARKNLNSLFPEESFMGDTYKAYGLGVVRKTLKRSESALLSLCGAANIYLPNIAFSISMPLVFLPSEIPNYCSPSFLSLAEDDI